LNPTEQTEYLIDLRRSRLQSLLAAGVNQTEYSRLLNVSEGTISGDCQYLRTRQGLRESVRWTFCRGI